MRSVARYQMHYLGNHSPGEVFGRVRGLVEEWITEKQEENASKGGGVGEATVLVRDAQLDGTTARGWTYREATPSGHFETIIDAVQHGQGLDIDIVLRTEISTQSIAPQRIEIWRPRVVAKLMEHRELCWGFGSSPLLSKPLDFVGEGEGKRLAQIILAPDRLTPLVVVSLGRVPGERVRALAQLLQQDLLGMSLVATCDAEASWAVSSNVPSGLSVYGEAVRVYWPGVARDRDKWKHPLFVVPEASSTTDVRWTEISRSLRAKMRRMVFDASAYSATAVVDATRLYRESEAQELRQQRARLTEQGDWEALAKSYLAEKEKLADELRETRVALDDERAKNRNLQEALRHKPNIGDEAVAEEETEVAGEPQSVAEAVSRAKRELSEFLTFGENVDSAVETLRDDAGPPDRVLDYLEGLALLVMEKRKGPLGCTDLKWLANQGMSASQESDTTKRNKSEMRRRKWPVDGRQVQFDFHLKPSDGTSPDRCVRIYFEWNDAANKIEIGYVGRHL